MDPTPSLIENLTIESITIKLSATIDQRARLLGSGRREVTLWSLLRRGCAEKHALVREMDLSPIHNRLDCT